MKDEFVLTQTKETTMTADKTVTVITEKLETIDIYGKRHLRGYCQSKAVDYHNRKTDLRGVA